MPYLQCIQASELHCGQVSNLICRYLIALLAMNKSLLLKHTVQLQFYTWFRLIRYKGLITMWYRNITHKHIHTTADTATCLHIRHKWSINTCALFDGGRSVYKSIPTVHVMCAYRCVEVFQPVAPRLCLPGCFSRLFHSHLAQTYSRH